MVFLKLRSTSKTRFYCVLLLFFVYVLVLTVLHSSLIVSIVKNSSNFGGFVDIIDDGGDKTRKVRMNGYINGFIIEKVRKGMIRYGKGHNDKITEADNLFINFIESNSIATLAMNAIGCPNEVADLRWERKLLSSPVKDFLPEIVNLCETVRKGKANTAETLICCGYGNPCVPKSCVQEKDLDGEFGYTQRAMDLKYNGTLSKTGE